MESSNGGGRCQQVPGQEAHIFNHVQIAENSELEVHQWREKLPSAPSEKAYLSSVLCFICCASLARDNHPPGLSPPNKS